mmetsp:Transcript_11922/g.14792  ORF Transcript_11922/g.14792 Transcript_11922/m.14792 type:complete len:214 (+) Transcript_11922:910-1551(+)
MILLAPSSDPWNAAQCNAFHPSLSVAVGLAPNAFIFLIASEEPFAPIAAIIINGVHPFAEVLKLILSFFNAFISGAMSASVPSSQVSNKRVSNELTLPFPSFSIFKGFCFPSFTGTPSPSTISSLSLTSSLYFSPKILRFLNVCSSPSSAGVPPPIKIALANAFSSRLNGPITDCMPRPMIIPLYQCKPQVMIIPNTVDPASFNAVESAYGPR